MIIYVSYTFAAKHANSREVNVSSGNIAAVNESEPDSVVVSSFSVTEMSFVVVSMVAVGGGVPVGRMKGMVVAVQLDVQTVTVKLSSSSIDSSKSRMCRTSVSSIRVIQEFSGGIWTYPAVVCFVVFSVRAV